MNIRPINSNDLKRVAIFCRENMEFDAIPDFLLKEKIFEDSDFNKDLCLIAEEKNLIIGFIMGVIRNHIIGKYGYIKLFAVKHSFRRKGTGSLLYDKLFDVFRLNNCERIRVYESHPNYYLPGIDPRYTEAICFFERKGFKKFNDTCNLLAYLPNVNFNTVNDENKLHKEGFEFKRAELSDYENLNLFLNKHFPLWIPEVSSSLRNNPVSVHICIKENKIIGFSGFEGNNKNTGWFGPMGTDPEFRGKNIGSILFKRCLKDMFEMGFTFATIPWVGPIPFYMNYANAKVDRVFWRYEKIL